MMDAPKEALSNKPRSAQSNPAWSRDVLILALDLYLRHRASMPSKNHPEVQELSLFLGKMGSALGVSLVTNFRNDNGVYMKLSNFRRWDPNYVKDGKKGLAKGNKLEGVVWAEYVHDQYRLAQVVAAIRAAVDHELSLPDPLRELGTADEAEIQEAEEGRVLTRMHRTRERDRKLVASKKKHALEKYGKLECEVCGFNFLAEYGMAGEGLIDVHHLKPVHTLRPGEKTHLNDLALLCANCHRVVHSSKRWLDIEQLRAAWAANR
ncbi:HNH endonuclease [Pseudomonas sichuanensis]|uniref:HNH endonuclease n=1 Tax=Pseudomonas sichuanensis TaxID=2213015 RepID=UPI0024471B75|nr:HNH endonuclease [Pseudomonas sichuanensis]MDH0733082.1 HNH endonuclease [Pseudomonas sichuanensis]MDH1582644.1 HNH endonuclease [Pseudomonas sichuanensis]MDH1592557.1 HNH endonuclease [Pseudomonas sichuanensis]MDH1597691.1 HNH endonuclease [Pseudomonas sichuanensis]